MTNYAKANYDDKVRDDKLFAAVMAGKYGKVKKTGRPSRMLKPDVAIPATAMRGHNFKPPQIGWFAQQWLASDFFAPVTKLRPVDKPYRSGTQANYRAAIELIRTQPLDGDGTTLADLPLTALTPRSANLYIQRIKREASAGAVATDLPNPDSYVTRRYGAAARWRRTRSARQQRCRGWGRRPHGRSASAAMCPARPCRCRAATSAAAAHGASREN